MVYNKEYHAQRREKNKDYNREYKREYMRMRRRGQFKSRIMRMRYPDRDIPEDFTSYDIKYIEKMSSGMDVLYPVKYKHEPK